MSNTPTNIDRLPDSAVPALQRAYDIIVRKRATLRELLVQLNTELEALSLRPVSYSGLARWAQSIRNGERTRPRLLSE